MKEAGSYRFQNASLSFTLERTAIEKKVDG